MKLPVILLALAIGAGLHSDNTASGKSHIIHWKDDAGAYSLEYTVKNDNGSCSLVTKFSNKSPEATWVSTRTDPHKAIAPEIKLIMPIRVAGSAAPELLVRLDRSNWLDYEIYAADWNGVDTAFSFSCRDPGAIKWVSTKGSLNSFVTYDRFEHAPESIRRSADSRTQFELRQTWTYNSDVNRWLPSKKKWLRYTIDSIGGHKLLQKPEDCDFRYNSEASGR